MVIQFSIHCDLSAFNLQNFHNWCALFDLEACLFISWGYDHFVDLFMWRPFFRCTILWLYTFFKLCWDNCHLSVWLDDIYGWFTFWKEGFSFFFLPQILLDISMFIFFHAIELLVFQKRQQLEPILLKLELYKVRNPVQSSFRFTNHLPMFVKQVVPLRT